jgi:hypothetical protein
VKIEGRVVSISPWNSSNPNFAARPSGKRERRTFCIEQVVADNTPLFWAYSLKN